MIQISTRYVPHVAALAVLALALVWSQRYSSPRVDDCPDASRLLPPVEDGAVIDREAPWRKRVSRYGRWTARRLPLGGDEGGLQFFAVRSYNPQVGYEPPEMYLLNLVSDRHVVERVVDGEGTLPVHRGYVGTYETAERRRETVLIGYVVVHDSKPLSNPILERLLAAPAELVQGRKPVWLFVVFGRVPLRAREEAERVLRETLLATWHDYQTLCPP